jgi:hypothetical protein
MIPIETTTIAFLRPSQISFLHFDNLAIVITDGFSVSEFVTF